MTTDVLPEDLAPLKVRCSDSNCEEGLHCYRATAKMVREKTAGPCMSCGIKLVDWDRVHRRDLSDAAFTFEIMRTEFIRHCNASHSFPSKFSLYFQDGFSDCCDLLRKSVG